MLLLSRMYRRCFGAKPQLGVAGDFWTPSFHFMINAGLVISAVLPTRGFAKNIQVNIRITGDIRNRLSRRVYEASETHLVETYVSIEIMVDRQVVVQNA